MTTSKVRHETGVQWTHVPGYIGATWNPTTGCSRLHDKRYLANRSSARAAGFTGPGIAREMGVKLPCPAQYDLPFARVQLLGERHLTEPLRAKKPRAYFVDSMADLFHEDVPDEFIDRVFAVMALSPRHIFMILTKRPGRMRKYVSDPATARRVEALAEVIRAGRNIGRGAQWQAQEQLQWPLRSVWLGVSVEDQERANERVPLLLNTPAAVRFLSCEPLLGPVDVARYLPICVAADGVIDGTVREQVDWVIVGGESGAHSRPMDLDWARSLRDQCAAAGVPFFMKQTGRWIAAGGPNEHRQHRLRSWLLADGRVFIPPVIGPHAHERPAAAVAWSNDPHGGRPELWPEDLRVREWPRIHIMVIKGGRG